MSVYFCTCVCPPCVRTPLPPQSPPHARPCCWVAVWQGMGWALLFPALGGNPCCCHVYFVALQSHPGVRHLEKQARNSCSELDMKLNVTVRC